MEMAVPHLEDFSFETTSILKFAIMGQYFLSLVRDAWETKSYVLYCYFTVLVFGILIIFKVFREPEHLNQRNISNKATAYGG